MTADNPLLVTVLLDDKSFEYFQSLRTQYFPPERNIVPAHLILFHNLPAGEREKIEDDLKIAALTRVFPMEVTGLAPMGNGVMFKIESTPLLSLRSSLAAKWNHWLIPQDRQPFKAHIVVQNKVTAAIARETLAALNERFVPFSASATGLQLWSYVGGPWRLEKTFAFSSENS